MLKLRWVIDHAEKYESCVYLITLAYKYIMNTVSTFSNSTPARLKDAVLNQDQSEDL